MTDAFFEIVAALPTTPTGQGGTAQPQSDGSPFHDQLATALPKQTDAQNDRPSPYANNGNSPDNAKAETDQNRSANQDNHNDSDESGLEPLDGQRYYVKSQGSPSDAPEADDSEEEISTEELIINGEGEATTVTEEGDPAATSNKAASGNRGLDGDGTIHRAETANENSDGVKPDGTDGSLKNVSRTTHHKLSGNTAPLTQQSSEGATTVAISPATNNEKQGADESRGNLSSELSADRQAPDATPAQQDRETRADQLLASQLNKDEKSTSRDSSNAPASNHDELRQNGNETGDNKVSLAPTQTTQRHANRRTHQDKGHSQTKTAEFSNKQTDQQQSLSVQQVLEESKAQAAKDVSLLASEVSVTQSEGGSERPTPPAGQSTNVSDASRPFLSASHINQTSTGEEQALDRIRVDPTRFVQRVAKAFQLAEDRNGQIRLRLSPPELGSIRLDVAIKQGVLSATIETETAAARRVLLDNLPLLRDRLTEQEIRIEQFDVNVRDENRGGENGQSMAFRDRPNATHTSPPQKQNEGEAGEDSEQAEPTRTTMRSRGDETLNVVA